MTPTLKNDRFLRALRREPVDATPVWLMRQAGRYLPEYRATRAKAGSFLAMAKNPDLACEVTLQPLARFDLDAAILFSDILTVPDAMGLGLYFVEGEGPKFERPVRNAADIAKLARARHGQRAALRDGCGVGDPSRTRRPRAADRFLRQPVDARVLHGRRRRQRQLLEGQAPRARRSEGDARAAVGQHRCGDRLPARAARGRCAGAAGVRYVGRRVVAVDVSRILAALPHAHRARTRARRCAADPVRQGQCAVSGRTGGAAARKASAWTG